MHAEDAAHGDIGEHGDFFTDLALDRVGGSAGDELGLDARFEESFDAELGGFGLLLAERLGLNDIGECDKAARAGAFFECEFAEGFDVESVFVIADGAPDFNEDDIGRACAIATQGEFTEFAFHLAGDMGDHLHIATEVDTLAFTVENFGKDSA